MRAIWKGSIAFGLVHIPVNLYPATESQSTVSSNLLHKKDHSRIRYQRVSEATGKEVPAEEIVRGFEVERDNFVVISDDELKEAAPEKSTAIEIQEFVNESQIPTLYFEKPYYLEPDKGAGKAYALLREALAQSGKVGVAQFVLRNRESLCVLKAQGNALTLNTLVPPKRRGLQSKGGGDTRAGGLFIPGRSLEAGIDLLRPVQGVEFLASDAISFGCDPTLTSRRLKSSKCGSTRKKKCRRQRNWILTLRDQGGSLPGD